MQIISVSTVNNQTKQQAFNGLHVVKPNVQKMLLTDLNNKHVGMLSKFIKEQENNSVHILLDSENGKSLKASLMCEYRMYNFKTEYKQVPFLESKIHFIKRIVETANKYKTQIKNAPVLKLEWNYSSLEEWIQKMYMS